MNIFLTKIFRSGFSIAASGLACTLSVATDQAMADQLRRTSDNSCLTAQRYTASRMVKGNPKPVLYTRARAIFSTCNPLNSEQEFILNAGQIWTSDSHFYLNDVVNDADGFSGWGGIWGQSTPPSFPTYETYALELNAGAIEGPWAPITEPGQEVLYGVAEVPDDPVLNSRPAPADASLTCQNSYFGDPIPNKPKKCYRWNQGNSNEWLDLANENATFTFPSSTKRMVRYGASSAYHYRVITPTPNISISCDSPTFGGDPIYGQIKACSVLTATPKRYITPKQGLLEIVE